MTGSPRTTGTSDDLAGCAAAKNGLLWEPILSLSTEGSILSAVCPAPVAPPPGAGPRLGERATGMADRIRLILGEFEPFARCGVGLFLPVRAVDFTEDPSLPQELIGAAASASVPPARVVLELREPSATALPAVLEAAERLRSTGMRISLGPGGTFDSLVEILLELRPDFLQVGPPVVSRCASDFFRQALLEAICELAWKFGATILAGGVENDSDLAMLRALGVRLVHGSLFSPPVPRSILLDPAVPGRFPFPEPPRPMAAEGPR